MRKINGCETKSWYRSVLTTRRSRASDIFALLGCYGALISNYRGADKSLARPGRKQARKHVRDARDFNNIETRAVIKFFFPARQGAEENSRHFDRNISVFPGRAKDLSAPLYRRCGTTYRSWLQIFRSSRITNFGHLHFSGYTVPKRR